MSVPSELMDVMTAGGGASPAAGAAPSGGPSSPPAGGAAPAGGPMSTPQPKAGLKQAAMVNIEMAVRLLEQAMSMVPLESEEKGAITSAHKTLVSKFGSSREKASELIPAEMMQLVQQMPGMGGGSPAAKAMSQVPAGKPATPMPTA